MTDPENPQTPPPAEGPPPSVPPQPPAAEPLDRLRRRPATFKPGKPPALSDQEVIGGKGPRMRELDDEIAQELEAALGGMSDKEMYGDPAQHQRRPAGPASKTPGRLLGKVVSIHGADVFVDVPGGRSQGVLSITQFPEGTPDVGTEVEVSIEGYDESNGLLLLTRKGAAIDVDWSSVAVNMVVEGRVTETNKGGLAIEVNGIRGFMPISQIDLYRVERPEEYVNQRLKCVVTEVNPEERNLVLSRRALLEREREENRERLWTELAEGQVRDGIVRSVRDFGAFVDLGGVDGLLHVSEMSWTRVKDPASVVQPGQTVKVMVLKLDRETRKVGLGLKQLTDSPWTNIEQRYPPGCTVTGKVTRTTEFGAFVELEPAVEGLIHISELAPQRVRRVMDIVKPEQEVKVMVLSIDAAQRRMALSLKAALPKEEPPPEEEEEIEEPAAEVKPPRPRSTPLRGGVGGKPIEWPK